MERSAYEILKVASDATSKEIKRAYKRLVRQYTPEQHPQQFMEIRAAYDSFSKIHTRAIPKFPLYKGQEQEVQEEQTTITKQDNKHWLSQIFETPYNTEFELKELLKD